jgi:uncharacterized protein (DUF433 family)
MVTQHIEVTPGIAGGKPRIVGHRITVQDVAIIDRTIAEGAAFAEALKQRTPSKLTHKLGQAKPNGPAD